MHAHGLHAFVVAFGNRQTVYLRTALCVFVCYCAFLRIIWNLQICLMLWKDGERDVGLKFLSFLWFFPCFFDFRSGMHKIMIVYTYGLTNFYNHYVLYISCSLMKINCILLLLIFGCLDQKLLSYDFLFSYCKILTLWTSMFEVVGEIRNLRHVTGNW